MDIRPTPRPILCLQPRPTSNIRTYGYFFMQSFLPFQPRQKRNREKNYEAYSSLFFSPFFDQFVMCMNCIAALNDWSCTPDANDSQ